MKVIILAGGKGERLQPLTNSLPKPMVLINNKPLISYSVNLFKNYGFTDICFTLCYFPQVIKKYFGTGKKLGITCSYLIENPDKPLGTAGALALLKKALNQTFIVCSGDSIRSCNITELIAFHKRNGGIATICVYNNKRTNPKSYITFDRKGKISQFVERPENIPTDTVWSNASLYVCEPEILKFIPGNIPSDFGKDIFPKLLAAQKILFAYKASEYFLDVGTKEKIKIAENDIKNGALRDEK